MHKLDWRPADEWVAHSHAPQFSIEPTSGGTARLVAGVPGGDASVLSRLIECLTPPYFVLYVLHTPRGEGVPGRYQSPELDLGALQSFIARFARFLAGDARFDLWVHSPGDSGTLVWDRHNLIYGYGPVECYSTTLGSLGFSKGRPAIPSPHAHNYRPELDADARALMSAFSWHHSPLRAEDQQ